METVILSNEHGFTKPVSAYTCYHPNFAVYKEVTGKRRMWTVLHRPSGLAKNFGSRGKAATFIRSCARDAAFHGDDLGSNLNAPSNPAALYWLGKFKS